MTTWGKNSQFFPRHRCDCSDCSLPVRLFNRHQELTLIESSQILVSLYILLVWIKEDHVATKALEDLFLPSFQLHLSPLWHTGFFSILLMGQAFFLPQRLYTGFSFCMECFIPILNETPTLHSQIKGHFFREAYLIPISKLTSFYYFLSWQTVLVLIIHEIFF